MGIFSRPSATRPHRAPDPQSNRAPDLQSPSAHQSPSTPTPQSHSSPTSPQVPWASQSSQPQPSQLYQPSKPSKPSKPSQPSKFSRSSKRSQEPNDFSTSTVLDGLVFNPDPEKYYKLPPFVFKPSTLRVGSSTFSSIAEKKEFQLALQTGYQPQSTRVRLDMRVPDPEKSVTLILSVLSASVLAILVFYYYLAVMTNNKHPLVHEPLLVLIPLMLVSLVFGSLALLALLVNHRRQQPRFLNLKPVIVSDPRLVTVRTHLFRHVSAKGISPEISRLLSMTCLVNEEPESSRPGYLQQLCNATAQAVPSYARAVQSSSPRKHQPTHSGYRSFSGVVSDSYNPHRISASDSGYL